jgi:hypothetical protein
MQDPLPVDKLVAEGVPNPIIQVISQMTAKLQQERFQSMTTLIDALTNALAVSNLPMSRSGRLSMMPPAGAPVVIDPKGGAVAQGPFTPAGSVSNPGFPSQSPFTSAPPYANSGVQPAAASMTIVCFRCGAPNPSTRLYCTTCGDDLSNKRSSADRYIGPNGRPILARLSIQNGAMGGRAFRFHQDVTTIGRTNGNDLVISGRTVSRRHARLWFDNGYWFLEDLQSANGTTVNNTRIVQPVMLNDNDIISFGDEIVVFNVIV